MHEFGEKLRKLRTDRGLTVKEACRQVGIPQSRLIELERGGLASAMPIRNIRPVTEYLQMQQRFRHLFTDEARAKEELEHIQAIADHNIEIYGLRGDGRDTFDSEGMDTVRRGGMRWA